MQERLRPAQHDVIPKAPAIRLVLICVLQQVDAIVRSRCLRQLGHSIQEYTVVARQPKRDPSD
jgi:hypothetical protein